MPSANDNFASRITLTPLSSGSASFDNTGNTLEASEPNPVGSFQRTGWYKITPTARRIFRFRVTALPHASAQVNLEFYRGASLAVLAAGRLTTAWADEDGGDSARRGPSNINLGWVTATVNTWYEFQLPADEIQIQVSVLNSAHEGTISFEWEEVTPPANDDWADAIDIDLTLTDLGSESGTTVGATWDTALTGHDAWPRYTGPSVFDTWPERLRGVAWYTMTSLSRQVYQLLLEPASAPDLRFVVMTGDTYPTQVHTGWGRPNEAIDVQLNPGGTYWVAVVGLNLGASDTSDQTRWRDTFDLSWERLVTPANDEWVDAEVISGDTGSSSNTDMAGATMEPEETQFNVFFPELDLGSVWWKYTPATTGLYNIETTSALTPENGVELGLWRGDDLATLERLDWEPGFTSSPPLVLPVGLRAGETYYIRLHAYTTSEGYSHLSDTDYGSLDWDLQTAAPANDDFADAETITGTSGTVSGDHSAATMEQGEYGRYFDDLDPIEGFQSFMPTVWYEWVCPATDTYRFETLVVDASGIDTDLTVFTGAAVESLTPVVENADGKQPDNGDYEAILEFEAIAGVTYYIRVSSFSWEFAGAFDLEWDVASPPANDDFADATALPSTQSGGPTTFDNLGADPVFEIGEPDAATETGQTEVLYGRSVWFEWTPPTTSTYEFEIDALTFSAHFMVYEAASTPEIDTLTLLANAEIPYDVDSVQFLADSSKTYYIRVVGAAFFASPEDLDPTLTHAVEQGQFVISWVRITTAPGNDDLTVALLADDAPGNLVDFGDRWHPSGGCVAASSLDATAEVGELSVAGFGPERTVWFLWIPDFTGTARFWTESSEVTDQVMAVYSFSAFNPAAPGTLLDADDDSGPGLMPECQFAVTAGDDYLIQVDTKDNPGGEFSLNWNRVTVSPPANDDFANAEELTVELVALVGDVDGATVECGELPQDFLGPYNSAWYHINSPVDRDIQITLESTTNNNPSGILAILYQGSTLETLVDVTDGVYPWVFGIGDTEIASYQLAAGEDYYISVSGFEEQQGSFEITYQLASLSPAAGDAFGNPIDSSPSAGGGPVYVGTTEGATLEAGEPAIDDIAASVWHKFIPDHDGIYLFSVIGDDSGDPLWFTVWEGASLATLKPIPGYYVSNERPDYLTANPRVLRGGSEYYIRIERFPGDPWETYVLNVVSYPEYDDWASVTAGYDSISGSGGYDSLNDQLTFTGEGSALVDPWLDVNDDPQNAGLRWIELRFKMRVTEGVSMYREGYFNALGVVRALDPDGDPVWDLAVTGNPDGTNSLSVVEPGGSTVTMFAHFGTREREFNEWVDVEVVLRANTGRHTVPTSYSTDVAVNGVAKRQVQHYQTDGVDVPAPFRTLEWGAFRYPDTYNTAGPPYGDPHDDWEIQIKDVVVRNRPTLGMLPPTDTGDLGIVLFDGWEHEDKLDNVDPVLPGVGGQTSTIGDAPGTPPGNADWWKSVRMYQPSGSGTPTGAIVNSWIHNCRPWVGFWLYLEEFPELDADEFLVLSYMPDLYYQGTTGWGALMLNGLGELRVAPQISERVWKSYCVAKLEVGEWYWIEMEVDAGIAHEATAEVSINGSSMGTFEFGSTYADLQSISPSLDEVTYTRFATSFFPMMWWLGPFLKVSGYGRASEWTPESKTGITMDTHFAHIAMGRAVTENFPLNAMQTKLFGGIDDDGTHNFPDLPVEYVDLDGEGFERYWTLYDYDEETDTPDPAVSGSAPAEFLWRTPGGGTIDVIADGGGPAEIAADNAVRWAPRGTIPDSPYGTKHFPLFGYGPRETYVTPEGGLSGDILVFYAWARGDGYLEFANYVSGNDRTARGTVKTLSGTYQKFWGAVHPPWHPSTTTVAARIESVWDSSPLLLADRMYWKSARILGNPYTYPRFATSSDNGASWTFLEDPTIDTTNTFIGDDVTVGGTGVFMNNTSAIKRLMEARAGVSFPSFDEYGLHSVGYEATEWYLEYLSVASPVIEYAEEFGGTRGYNLHLRHGGYAGPPKTARSTGELYVTLWNGTHRAPHHVVSAASPDISRVRYPTDCTGGHWTTSEFEDTRLRFGYHRALSAATTYWSTNQRGALLEAVQWEVLSQAAPGPAPRPCRRMPQIYRLVYY